MKTFILVAMLLTSMAFAQEPKTDNKRHITLVNYETNGVKQWLPGTIIVKKGETVELTLINNVTSGLHGFSIPAFDVRKEVKKGVKEVFDFVATKEGLFEVKCQLHPAHVGGQLLVIP